MTYSTKVGFYRNHPYLEVLRNGNFFGAENKVEGKFFGKDHFSFGVEKARMILESLDFIKLFLSNYPNYDNVDKLKKEYDWFTSEVKVDFEPYNVAFPYVYLESKTYNKYEIGFGKMKSEALLSVIDEIAKFVKDFK